MSLYSQRGGLFVALLVAATAPLSAALQARTSPEPYVVQNVRIERAPDGRRATLILRDGRIAGVLEPDAALPAGVRIIDGAELLALSGFVDAYSRAGSNTATPVAVQDVPVDVQEDVQVDMRVANRKGLQPAFHAVDAVAIDAGLVNSLRVPAYQRP
jgi:hypothetical protein